MRLALIRLMSMLGLVVGGVGLAVVGGYIGYFLSGCIGFVFFYILITSLWMRRGDIIAERMFHQMRIQDGDEIEVTVKIHLPAPYWLCWIIVEERWVHQHRQTEEEQYACLAFVRGSRQIKCHYRTSTKTRGLYHVHSSRVMIGDMFGLVRRVLVQEERDAEIVHVNPLPLKGDWFKGVQRGGETPTSYGTLRDYANGDPISSIDWKSYARYQKLKTKQLEPEEQHSSILIVMDARKGSPANFERLVSAVSRMVLELNDPSLQLILACGESRCLVIPHHDQQLGVRSEVDEWLTTIEASSLDSYAEQLRKALAQSTLSEGDKVIGVTAASDEQTRRENNMYIYQQSIQLLYIPPIGEHGEQRYA